MTSTLIALAAALIAGANPVEVGSVRWGRDLDAALKTSDESGRPVFLLFQEIPGCAGCRTFGKTVLTHPLLVEAIEEAFVPVLVHNNKGGADKEILDRFDEPAWNFQVVRFLDADARDLIPRKDRVWTIGALSTRMVRSLRAAKRPVPRYLEALAAEHDTTNHATGAFAMHCFWTGEMKLGAIDGVVTTEAGWLEGREVTRVVYDRTKITLAELSNQARSVQCADKVYAPDGEAKTLDGYRPARASDQKKQIASMAHLRQLPGITSMQLTKINALARVDAERAMAWLSPRQCAELAKRDAARIRPLE